MKVADLLESRRQNWRELEELCGRCENWAAGRMSSEKVARFCHLYRAVCADLALADAYNLPQPTVAFLHHLVGRAHNQLYRTKRLDFRRWGEIAFVDIPRRLFNDWYFRIAFLLFYGCFFACMVLAYADKSFAERMVGGEQLSALEEMYSQPMQGRTVDEDSKMAGFYIQHNTSIGLRTFCFGLIAGFGGLLETVFNACSLGAMFGFMANSQYYSNFFTFVTAHGPFELTAIVLAAAAGMRIGFAFVNTGGWTRKASIYHAGRDAVQNVLLACLLFLFAAFLEGFLSPSAAPYWLKLATAMVSSFLMLFYVLVLGYPRKGAHALDKTRVAIRERSYLDIVELALRLLQGHAYPLVMAWLVGVVPFFFLNMLLLSRQVPGSLAWESAASSTEELDLFFQIIWYVWLELTLVILEAPLATSLITLFLGQALFLERPPARRIAAEFWNCSGQLLFMQFVLRGATLMLFCITSCVWYWVWPYTSEIILLERNKQEITWRRMSELHRLNGGFLFARWLAAVALGFILLISVWVSQLLIRGALVNRFVYDDVAQTCGLTWEFPLALWIVFGFFTIVRFLSYLDLRIRGEGWELALALRALAATLKPKWT